MNNRPQKDLTLTYGKWNVDPWSSSTQGFDSPRCSSMSLTDLVEKASPMEEDPLDHANIRYNLTSNRSSLANQIQYEFAKEVDMDALWMSSSPGQSSPSRKSVSKRDSCIGSTSTISEPISSRGSAHGLLQCSLRDGLPSYTFLLDDYDEVVTAKIWMEDIRIGDDEGAWRYMFYSLRGESNKRKGKKGWKHWSPKEKLASELVGKMTVSSVLCTGKQEGRCHGDGNNMSVRSEFVLSMAKAQDSSPIQSDDYSFSYSSLNSSSSLESGSYACGAKSSYNNMLMNTSTSPSSDSRYSSMSSPSAISAWYVSQSLIPSNLASPDHSLERKQKSRKWSLHSKTWARKAKKSNRVVGTNSDESQDMPMRLSQNGLNSELAAMIINVPLDIHNEGDDEGLLVNEYPEVPSLHERIGLHDQSMLCVSRSDSEIEVEAETSCFDPKNESYKQPNITVILPSGCHGRPLGIDSKGPPPLIKRWKEGGKCDCKGWDLGCGMMVLSDQQPKTSQGMESSSSLRLGSHKNDGKQLVLYKQDGDNEDEYLSLAPHENGLIAVDFRAPLSPLQAFAMAVAILHGRGSSVSDPHTSHGMVSGISQRSRMVEQYVDLKSNSGLLNSMKNRGPPSSMFLNHDISSMNDVFGCASTLSFDRL